MPISTQLQAQIDAIQTRIIPMRGDPREITPATGSGGHGGGDTLMLAEIFDPAVAADPHR